MNNIKFAWKAIARFKTYTIINLLGLSLSLACVMIIVRYIHQELTVNRFCTDLNNTYLLLGEFHNRPKQLSSNEDRNNDPNFVDPMKSPAVLKSTRFLCFSDDKLSVDEQWFNVKTYVTDSVFLQILPYPLLAGSGSLKSPNDAIITKALAHKLFGTADPLGKTFTYSNGNILTVTGIIDSPATKSSFLFDLLISEKQQREWSRMSYSIALLAPGTNYKQLNEQNHFMNLMAYREPMRLQFFPLKDFYFDQSIHLYDYSKAYLIRGNSSNLIVLFIISLSLLVIGLFNFINIYTVVIMKRSREFGIKKVYGCGRKNIFLQILIENMLIATAALGISWFLIEVTEGILEHALDIPRISDITFSGLLSLALLALLPLLTSLYPFFKYTCRPPIVSIRSIEVGDHSIRPRIILLSLQYLITFVLTIVSLFFMKQVHFMLNTDLAYQTKDIIQCQMLSQKTSYDIRSEEEWNKNREREKRIVQTIQQQMDACPYFITWEYGENPNQLDGNFTPVKNVNQDTYQPVVYSSMSSKYMKMFGFKLKEGRLWNDSIDHWDSYLMIVNESAKKLLNIGQIETALIQPESRLWWNAGAEEEMDKNPPYQVVGVIEDFKIGHLSKTTSPLFIVYDSHGSPSDRLMAQIVPGKRKEAIEFLRRLHDEVVGQGNFEYTFLEDEVAAMYKEDKRTSEIYVLFTLIAIVISCMGLFALSLFDIQQRYREIALRKVNGATLKEIYPLLLKKYAVIGGVTFIISIPLSWYILIRYLEGFANKAPISWWIFVLAGAVTLIVSFTTLIWQVRKAAGINPSIVLKGE
ncbi:ABC transporter permease [Bacteroides sp.]